ncbi:phosphatidylethanolamine N-methyltransferase NDAI_0H00470 [Naumovozyma dairenensis CBS 421]|uniref:Phosphatidylethanolamine N-methyltransferase n=1 Tax=Naumovozyma dairenensis (strain ATCC 10597 / BCRC 20456 / CBS 421 / NBRC 0211 / NRRL Y-12639) TaxID=1071378 RepID=G0WEL0_NAUDC|nr:hypothetical protein NDAI_0H00470 [Naumovozyma dairenensis CBS 421]CCD26221.1 hypothetical protein NDAI_0H00470 [Naumovozyma dairenensis CBS 421]
MTTENTTHALASSAKDPLSISLSSPSSVTNTTASRSRSTQHEILAKTRSTGILFKPPKTHDMVRSLFDPTIKKSFLELCITLFIISNFFICHKILNYFDLNFTKRFYLLQYLFWRLSYNLGIGIILHYQSNYESLTNFVTKNNVFTTNNSLWARFLRFELHSILSKQQNKKEKHTASEYPNELKVWLIFRQFVDLILMQDFITYIIFVYLSLPTNLDISIWNWKIILGTLLIVFNIWAKIDAHRVIKDFAWYWGDFFFLQINSTLIFDVCFNISPHPMYSIGYLGYYGLSLICNDYKVLLVSIWGHFLQFLFLKYVESPHIERTYGTEDGQEKEQISIDDLILKENYDYSKPLIFNGLMIKNFNKLRIYDYFTVGSVISIITWAILTNPNDLLLLTLTFTFKLSSWLIISIILYNQSNSKWFTKLFLKNGFSQIHSYQQWQFIYNFMIVTSYVLLIIQTISKIISNNHTLQSNENFYNKLIFGLLLCSLQIWSNSEINLAISDFGWFYGDFFLTNYIPTKNARKLTSQGIYRYLNNPETIFGIIGIWSTVLMTNFAWENIILSLLWTITNFIMIKFIEKPHIMKIYGSNQSKRISGVGKSLLTLKPLRRISEIVDNVEHIIMRSLLNNNANQTNCQLQQPTREIKPEILKIRENVMVHAINNVTSRLSPNCEFDIQLQQINLHDEEVSALPATNSSYLPNPISIKWKLPIELYDETDWIGLYNVLDTRADREITRTSSFGHKSFTTGAKNKHVLSLRKSEEFVKGEICLIQHYYICEPGIYEFRYHSKNSHKVLLISTPFQVLFPKLNFNDDIDTLRNDLFQFLNNCNVIANGKFFNQMGNKYFTMKSLQKLIKASIGIELSTDFINNVNGDIDIISKRIWEIKKILDELV